MRKKILITSTLLCAGLATCQLHFENDNVDLTLKGECRYEDAQKNETSEGQKSLFENCRKNAQGE